MVITDAALEDAERIVTGYNTGRIKESSLAYHLYGGAAYVILPAKVEAAFDHAAEAHRIWMVSEEPDGGRNLPPGEDPLRYAETCRVLLDEALAELVQAIDAYTASRNTMKGAA